MRRAHAVAQHGERLIEPRLAHLPVHVVERLVHGVVEGLAHAHAMAREVDGTQLYPRLEVRPQIPVEQ